jgi:methyl-accepting chemotaxis protein
VGEVIELRRTDGIRSVRNDTDWIGGIESVGKGILELNGVTEREFLAIGGSLQDFSRRSTEISEVSMSASAVMAGDEIAGAIGGLRGMIQQLEGLFEHTERASGNNIEALRGIRGRLGKVGDELNGLQETSKTLKMLALSTKIQSTNTGKGLAAFMQLGQDISQMSGIISVKSSELLSDTIGLAGFVDDVLSNLGTLRGNQQHQIRKVLDGTRSIVDSLEGLSGKAVEETQRINLSTLEISKSVSDLVMSVQYQDITRQALEKIHGHLIESRNAETENGNSLIEDYRAQGASLPAGILTAGECMRQVPCLRDAGGKMQQAVLDIITSLKTIAEGIKEMSTLAGSASRDSSSFLEKLEEGISSVTSFLSEVVESSKEMSGAMNSLASSIEGMSRFTDDIEMISSEVELISLNARVMAAQTGREGAGMSVIAGAVHSTANNSEQQRQSLVMKLKEISDSAVNLKTDIEAVSEGEERRLDILVRELGVFLDALRMMQRRVVDMLVDINSKSGELHEEISSSINRIQIHNRIESLVMGLSAEMVSLAEGICGLVPIEELHHLTGRRVPIQEIAKMDLGEKVNIIEEYTQRQGSDPCFENGSGNGDHVLFED